MKFRTLAVEPDTDEVRTAERFGRDHVVAPVVMVQEGVLKDGFVPAEEIQYSANGWNGRPITAPPEPGTDAYAELPDDLPDGMSGHPLDSDGQFVSANNPPYDEDMIIGSLRNVEVTDDAKLRGEAWLDVERIESVGEYAAEVVRHLRDGEPLDVSIGFWHDIEESGGTFNDSEYDHVVRNIMPDHLAMLPNETGACSWGDGCGLPRAATALVEDDRDPEGAMDAETFIDRLAKRLGITPSNTPTNANSQPMQDNIDIDALSERTGVATDTLEAMSDDELSSLCDCVEAASDGDGGDGGDGDGGDGGSADDTPAYVEELRETIEAQNERIESLSEQLEERNRPHDAIETIVAHTERDAEELADWPDDAIEALAERVKPTTGFDAAGPGVNHVPQAGAATASDDGGSDEVPDSPPGALAGMTAQEADD